jgi:hypothetical protein
MAREKRDRRTSPAGVAVYPHLNTPDTTFDADGVYVTKLRFTGEAENNMRSLLDDLYAKAQVEAQKELKEQGSKKKARPGPEPYQEDEENGGILVNFKKKASGKLKDGTPWTGTLRMFDAAGNPCPDAKVGGGSTLKVAYEPNLYYVPAIGAGVSCRLVAVQVLDLVEWGASASTFGFDEEEGYTAPSPKPTGFEAEADSDSEEDDDDF